MAIWQYDLVAIPRKSVYAAFNELPKEIPVDVFDQQDWWHGEPGPDEQAIGDLLPKTTSWLKSVKAWGTSDGNRMELHFNDGGRLFEFRIRIDLREPSAHFIVGILRLAARHDYIFWTDEEKLLAPDLTNFLSEVKKSRAFSFVSNPTGFLDRLNVEHLG